jgi:hypothetical protein
MFAVCCCGSAGEERDGYLLTEHFALFIVGISTDSNVGLVGPLNFALLLKNTFTRQFCGV